MITLVEVNFATQCVEVYDGIEPPTADDIAWAQKVVEDEHRG